MLPVLEVPGQLQRGAAVVVSFLSDDCPSLNVACVGSVRSTSGGGLQLLSGVLLKDESPSLNVACVGSARSISGGLQLLACFFER